MDALTPYQRLPVAARDALGWLTETDFDLYQLWMSNLLVRLKRVLLGAFMGSGKTAVVLWSFVRLREAGEARRMLVIAPKTVARETWPEEIETWTFSMGLRYSVVVGTAEERAAALRVDADIHILNRENVGWFYEYMEQHDIGWPWDVLVYDEASRLKSGQKRRSAGRDPQSGRRRFNRTEFGYVSAIRDRFVRAWLLSGTPSPNGLIDLWGPVYILDGGERLGWKRSAFVQRWFSTSRWSYAVVPHDHSEAEIMGRLKDVFFYLEETDYIELPELEVTDRIVTLEPQVMKMYKRFEREMVLEELDAEAVNNAVLCNKLLQFANGSVYAEEDDDGSEYRKDSKPVAKHVHSRKLDELASIIEEAAGRPLLIAYSYKFDVHAIKKRFPWVRVFGETKNDYREWNSGKLRAMMLHPASAAHGLNFQSGGHLAVWYGLNWSLELYQQFNKRLHRRGQKSGFVRLYRILARGTRDLRVAKVLHTKDATQESLTNLVRVHVDKVLREAA